jgi:hypothetical protein
MRPRTPGQPCAALHTDGNARDFPSATDLIGRGCSTVPLAYHIDEHSRLVTITGDYAEPAEWQVLLNRVRSDARLKPGFGFMRDLRYSMHPVDAHAVLGIITVVRQMWSVLGVRRAAMVTRPGIDVPAAVAHALAEDENMPLRAFTSYDDAVGWLAEG